MGQLGLVSVSENANDGDEPCLSEPLGNGQVDRADDWFSRHQVELAASELLCCPSLDRAAGKFPFDRSRIGVGAGVLVGWMVKVSATRV